MSFHKRKKVFYWFHSASSFQSFYVGKSAENLNLNFICLPNHFFFSFLSNFAVCCSLFARLASCQKMSNKKLTSEYVKVKWDEGRDIVVGWKWRKMRLKSSRQKKNTITKSMAVRKYEEFFNILSKTEWIKGGESFSS